MEIKTKVVIDALTERGVTVKTQRYVEVEGEVLPIGEIHATAYTNNERGRKDICATLEEPYLSAVMAVWGDVPKVFEEVVL